jgi:four helix bundle protein
MAGDGPDVKGRQGLATLDIGSAAGREGGMNEPEVTMLDATRSSNLIVTSTAVTAAGKAIELVMRVPAPLRALADQVVRAASSVPANLSEGHGRSGRDRLYHWRIAYGSAKEVDCHLRLLVHAGAIDPKGAEIALGLFDQVRAMTWRLLHPKA